MDRLHSMNLDSQSPPPVPLSVPHPFLSPEVQDGIGKAGGGKWYEPCLRFDALCDFVRDTPSHDHPPDQVRCMPGTKQDRRAGNSVSMLKLRGDELDIGGTAPQGYAVGSSSDLD